MIEWLRSCADSLADDFSRIQIRSEIKFLSRVQNEFNAIKRKNSYVGSVLSNAQSADLETVTQLGERISVKMRLQGLNDQCIPDPCDASYSEEEQKRLIACHPVAYSEKALVTGERAPRFGDQLICRLYGDSPDFMGRQRKVRYAYPSSREKFNYQCALKIDPPSASQSFNNSSVKTLSETAPTFDNPYNLSPAKGKYQGNFMAKGTDVLNGYPVHGKTLLKVPDTTYFKPYGTGAILIDYIEAFDKLCKAFSDHFTKPGQPRVRLYASGIRDFAGQIAVRQREIDRGTCQDMNVRYGHVNKAAGQTRGCPTAIPGTSDHGWGQAVDIRSNTPDANGQYRAIRESSEEFKWLHHDGNAEKYGFHFPIWNRHPAPEPWHMEPIKKLIVLTK
jgi:hypothetical protein